MKIMEKEVKFCNFMNKMPKNINIKEKWVNYMHIVTLIISNYN